MWYVSGIEWLHSDLPKYNIKYAESKDGKIWTSSGVSAGIDLALAFIKHESGEDAAGKVQALTEYYPSGKKYGKSRY